MERKTKVDLASSYQKGQQAGTAVARKAAPWIVIVLAMLGAAWGSGLIP